MINTRAGSVGLAMAIVLSLCGLVLTGLLLDYHVKLAAGGTPIVRPLCEWSVLSDWFGPRFSCDEALTSKWSRFPFWTETGYSIPTTLIGFIYFAAVSAWFLIVGRPSGSRYSWHWFAVLLTAAGAGVAAFLAYRMFAALSTICSVCLAAEAIAVLLFILTLLIWPRRRQVAVMAEPVSGVSRTPVAVRVPAPDYPPGRALLAWLLMTASVSTVGWLGYRGIIRSEDAGKALAELRVKGDEKDALARKSQRDLELAQAETAAVRAKAAAAVKELEAKIEQLTAQHKTQVEKLAAETKESQAKIDRLNDENRQNLANIERLTTEGKDQKARAERLAAEQESQIDKLNGEIQAVSARLREVEGRRDALARELEAARAELEKAKRSGEGTTATPPAQ